MDDDAALARALARLIGDTEQRQAMGLAARAVARRFTDLHSSMTALAESVSRASGRDISRP
jgi:hypothetical protein